jgi:hypothetical protein
MEKQFWGERAMFAGYSGNSAYSWGKKNIAISAAQKLILAYFVKARVHYRGLNRTTIRACLMNLLSFVE